MVLPPPPPLRKRVEWLYCGAMWPSTATRWPDSFSKKSFGWLSGFSLGNWSIDNKVGILQILVWHYQCWLTDLTHHPITSPLSSTKLTQIIRPPPAPNSSPPYLLISPTALGSRWHSSLNAWMKETTPLIHTMLRPKLATLPFFPPVNHINST